MHRSIKIIFALLMCFVLLLTGCSGVAEKFDSFEITGYGLHVASDGTITLNGKTFYAFGVNWHGCVSMSKNSPNAEEYWKKLAENNVPVVRMMFGVFYPDEYSEYDNDPEKYFGNMEAAVAYAEKYHIGIIASLMWNFTAIPQHLGESYDTLTDRNSATMQYTEKYLSTLIDKFKDSPAIFAWEIGNEGSESPDTLNYIKNLPDGGKSLERWTYEDLSEYYRIVGDIIYEHDSYRMITGGDMSPRHASNALRDTHTWAPLDTYEDTLESITYLNPGHVNCSSVHYPEVETWLDWYMKSAKELKIAFWVGEFHGELFDNLRDELSAEESPEEANEQKTWNDKVDAYLEKGVQMFCTWTYARYEQMPDNTSLELGVFKGIYQNYYQISRIKKVNDDFVSSGKNKSADYWADAEYLFSDYFSE